MKKIKIKQIDNLFNVDVTDLLKQSKDEGYRFIERLLIIKMGTILLPILVRA
ncbi:MAG: hypothetical protein ACQEWU_13445 [Bacillota bacterium]